MMNCPKCQNPVTEDMSYCVHCGQGIIIKVISSVYAWCIVGCQSILSISYVSFMKAVVKAVEKNFVGVEFDSHYTTTFLFTLISAIGIIIFVALDINQSKKYGHEVGCFSWFLGICLLPAYLFIRAINTKSEYYYAITSSLIYVVTMAYFINIANSINNTL